MKKQFTVTINNTFQYIQVFNGVFKLTNKEILVLSKFVDYYQKLAEHDIDVFSAEIKKKIAEELNMSDFNMLNNYIKSLKDKRAIQFNGETYKINRLLLKTEDEEGVYFKWQTKTN